MNKRQVNILNRILIDPQFYTIARVSDFVGKTERTVYNDLIEINYFLSKFDIPPIVPSDDGNIGLEQKSRLVTCLRDCLKFNDYELNSEEREFLVFLSLLFVGRFITINQLADQLLVSRTTILKNLANLRGRLTKSGITLTSNAKKGICLSGDERKLRQVFVEWSKAHTYIANIYLRDQMSEDVNNSSSRIYKNIISGMLEIVTFFTEESLECLRLYLLLAVERIYNGNIILPETVELKRTKKELQVLSQTLIIELIDKSIADEEKLKGEVAYLVTVLNSLHTIRYHAAEADSLVTMQFLASIFIEDISNKIGLELTTDRDLLENLSNHMADTAKQGISNEFENFSIQVYMEKNAYMLDHVRASAIIFEDYLGRPLSDLDLGYISLHVSAAIEKLESTNHEIRVLLICNSGIGTAQLLKAKLQRNYSFQIVDIIPVFQLSAYDQDKIDCIISTVPITSKLDIPYVDVSVNLTNSDLAAISNLVINVNDEKRRLMKITGPPDKNKLMQKVAQVTNAYPGLYKQLVPVIQNYWDYSIKSRKKTVGDFLNKDLIGLDIEAKDWRMAIKAVVGLLEKNGSVDKQFCQKAIESVELYGPYIIIAPNVAFPHGGTEQGACITAFSFVRLKTPVYFEEGKGCDLFFALSAADNTSHLDALFSLVDMANDDKFRTLLREAKTEEELLGYIRDFEERNV